VIRRIARSAPHGHLRVWLGGDWPSEPIPSAPGICVEFAGRLGHPTSYGLLGGIWLPQDSGAAVRFALHPDGQAFEDSLAGPYDKVLFGLPEEYRSAVGKGVRRLGVGRVLSVQCAAHGQVGSSPQMFAWLAGSLFVLAENAYVAELSDVDLWREFDEGRKRVGSLTPRE
jgi:hypothetical protein